MNTSLRITIILLAICCLTESYAGNPIPILDTIVLKSKHVEGRWVEKAEGKKDNIYIFRDDNTFHKATDDGEMLFFNIGGKYDLSNDSIKVFYQDLSRQTNRKVRVKSMHFRVVSLSDDELNVHMTENNRTQFVRLKRQK